MLSFRVKPKVSPPKLKSFPQVTIQIPVYNEYFVIEAILNSIKKLKWPKNKLLIQILDDSEDQTTELIKKKIKELEEEKIIINHIIRKNRAGFKAGALENGFLKSKSKFFAIFDADFIIDENFLMDTIPLFKDRKIGIVQTRWAYINKNDSLLTKIQALALDLHFNLEQSSKSLFNYFLNFNGSGGVIRRECLEAGGGWKAGTLTEDLELSYRVQIKGWKIKYFPYSASPSQIPTSIEALKSQQYRWTKGGAQCARIYLTKILFHPKISFLAKLIAISHLGSGVVFLAIFLVFLLGFPFLLLHQNIDANFKLAQISQSFFITFLAALVYFLAGNSSYQAANKKDKPKEKKSLRNFFSFIFFFFSFISISISLALRNVKAVMEGYLNLGKLDFVRTPKIDFKMHKKKLSEKKYFKSQTSFYFCLEIVFITYASIGLVNAVIYNNLPITIFYLISFLGLLYTLFLSIKEWLNNRKNISF